tara:strand:- start:1304 stop:2035 length:732 start_codon:yes stop_codon:yes gene_type:complete
MNVIIYAAGVARRLNHIISNGIKGLIEINGMKLIEYQLRWISKLEIENIVLVIGLEHQQYIDFLGDDYNGIPIKYVFNKDYKTKGNMLSLWHAREYCNSNTLFTTSDLLCNLEDIQLFNNTSFDNKILIDNKTKALFTDSDPVKVSIMDKKIIGIRKKNNELKSVDGISVGIYQFSYEFMLLLLKNIEIEIDNGNDNQSLYYSIDTTVKELKPNPIIMNNCNWIDIDTSKELNMAIKNINFFG